eukprot:8949429-Pyramimonas_sp.AAC.1
MVRIAFVPRAIVAERVPPGARTRPSAIARRNSKPSNSICSNTGLQAAARGASSAPPPRSGALRRAPKPMAS